MIDIKPIQQLIEKSNGIIIAGHINPDGDAIGSCLALAMALKKLGKNPVVLLESYSATYDFLPGTENIIYDINENDSNDLFIALDCGDESRLGENKSLFQRAHRTINIDHHVKNPQFGDFNLVIEQASSTSEIIYEVIKMMRINLDKDIATALYTGIIYDTGGFLHTNTTTKTHEIAGTLLDFEIDFSSIINRLFHTRTYKSTKLLGKAFENLLLLHDGKLCFSSLSKEEIQNVGCDYKDTDGIIKFLSEVEGIEVAILIYEREYKDIKVSFRSFGMIDVSQVARGFGGGGHVKASGCSLKCSLGEAKNKILQVIEGQLDLLQ